jgi:hypothetical protein
MLSYYDTIRISYSNIEEHFHLKKDLGSKKGISALRKKKKVKIYSFLNSSQMMGLHRKAIDNRAFRSQSDIGRAVQEWNENNNVSLFVMDEAIYLTDLARLIYIDDMALGQQVTPSSIWPQNKLQIENAQIPIVADVDSFYYISSLGLR